jgi:hypothetical protein
MKSRNCPNCKTEVTKYWPNPINKNMLVGRCSTCRKTVNLGKPGNESESAPPTRTAGDGKKEKGKAKEKSGRKKTRSQQPGSGSAPPAAPAKRSGIGAAVRSFFEFD